MMEPKLRNVKHNAFDKKIISMEFYYVESTHEEGLPTEHYQETFRNIIFLVLKYY